MEGKLNMGHLIRRAREEDIPRILELLVQVNMVHHNGRPDVFKGPTTKYNAKELEAILADDQTPVFVCCDEEGRIMGHAFCVHKQELNSSLLTDIRTLYIDDICVDEACRGYGVGSALYSYVLDYARGQGCYNVTLNVWCCNPNALKFYESMGIKPQKIGMEVLL